AHTARKAGGTAQVEGLPRGRGTRLRSADRGERSADVDRDAGREPEPELLLRDADIAQRRAQPDPVLESPLAQRALEFRLLPPNAADQLPGLPRRLFGDLTAAIDDRAIGRTKPP